MMIAEKLDAALKAAGIPIIGVRITGEDRRTWTVDYAPEASKDDIAAGDAIVQAFDPEAVDVKDAESERAARRFATSREMRAAWLANFRMLNRRNPTAEEREAAHAAFVQAFKDSGP